MKPAHGRNRVVIEEINPQVDGGRHPVCRILGDEVVVTAAIFGDGHDHLAAQLLYQRANERRWRSVPLTAVGNDLWTGSFKVDKLGAWRYTILGWVDHFITWESELRKRLAAQDPAAAAAVAEAEPTPTTSGGWTVSTMTGEQNIPLALRTGAILIKKAAERAGGADAKRLAEVARYLNEKADRNDPFYDYPLDAQTVELVNRYPDQQFATRYEPELPLWVDRERARFSTWYELFPRSTSPDPGTHGTFADVEQQLPEIAAMGFDILYLPPIHPIGSAFRKGPEQLHDRPSPAIRAAPGPSATGRRRSVRSQRIKEDDGGHKSIHPELGTFADFDHLVAATQGARHGDRARHRLPVLARSSLGHASIPTWFNIRPDGSIQYAENPPKKYQDIYPLNFESPDWRGLWDELYSVFEFWIERGVASSASTIRTPRPFPSGSGASPTLRTKYPDTIFLAEAFTRPHVMYWLAKARLHPVLHLLHLAQHQGRARRPTSKRSRKPPVSDFFRPNFWPNTPDILHKSLQDGGRPAFMQRLILAATLTANYGIYGPAYELCENAPAKPAPGKTESEEYLDSEKYEIRQRDRNAPGSLRSAHHPAQPDSPRQPGAADRTSRCTFTPSTTPICSAYSKIDTGFQQCRFSSIVNLDPYQPAVRLDRPRPRPARPRIPTRASTWKICSPAPSYTWHDRRNYVALRPGAQTARTSSALLRLSLTANNGASLIQNIRIQLARRTGQ